MHNGENSHGGIRASRMKKDCRKTYGFLGSPVYFSNGKNESLHEGIDLFRETRFLASRVVLMENMVRGGLVNGLVSCVKEGCRFLRVFSRDGIDNLADRLLYASLFRYVSRMTLCIGFNTQDR